ncbi:MAG: tetratricopeptide repeat protein [candidate division Zixibacteria bacterium]|nr:tetratricopeptide repeat protein [Candidatus Tariuqbacter arcticus]
MPHNILIIRHIPDSEAAKFQVEGPGGKAAKPVELQQPFGFPVKGRPESGLMRELQWYLEEFLSYPYPPNTDRAENIIDAIKEWGRQSFNAVFDDVNARRMFDRATENGHEHLHLQIRSDDSRILAWPWEALRDPEAEFLGQNCQIERRLEEDIRDPIVTADELPDDIINILLVTARPYKQDIRFRSVSRSLVNLIVEGRLPGKVHLLRPPTLDNLCRHLAEHPNFYHILHFDGHGAFGVLKPEEDDSRKNHSHAFQGPQGYLVFEDDDGNEKLVSPDQLRPLLRDYQIPAVVLNACQSAMQGIESDDPFAAVSTSLLKAGVPSVVAMAYSLYVRGAQVFLPEFYGELFKHGDVAKAARAGRLKMVENPERISLRGTFKLEDWLVPVLYQQEPFDFSFITEVKETAPAEESKLPREASDSENPYGFIGRDGALLELERAIRRKTPAVLIQGLGGVGKTTLARGFLKWLEDTGGLGSGCFWLTFHDIRNADFVFGHMGTALFGAQFLQLNTEEKIELLIKVFRERRYFIVWDNFEAAKGIEGTYLKETMDEENREYLLTFLKKLRGGKSKVIITSRSEEDWLGVQRAKITIGGLDGEEQWEYCETIIRELGLDFDRKDAKLVELMRMLNGHPLAMRALLPKLEKFSPGEIIQALNSNIAGLGLEDQSLAKTYATLQFVSQSLPEEWKPLLIPLGMHEKYVDGDYLEMMAKRVDEKWSREVIDDFLEALVKAGLLRNLGGSIYEMHPALTGFLRSTVLEKSDEETRDRWTRAFVDIMGSLAEAYGPRPMHEQRPVFQLHGANFHYAMNEAERLKMDTDYAALLQAKANYALEERNFKTASDLYEQYKEHKKAAGDEEGEAVAYHQLGIIAEERRDFKTAEKWYMKSLAIEEKLGNEQGAAQTYHQFGRIAQEQRDFKTAEKWYLKALNIFISQNNEHHAAITYHQLGRIAQEQRDFKTAEKWYLKSLEIKDKLGNEQDAASTYHQLGRIAQEQHDLKTAEKWYLKSLAIEEKLGNEDGIAITYHQLGRIAQEQRDFKTAEEWYLKSLAINNKIDNESEAAKNYHQLGMIAEEQRDFQSAEEWYLKSLAIEEKLGNESGAAQTYHQLGIIAGEQRDFNSAENWYLKSLEIKEKLGDKHFAASTYGQLGILAGLQGRFAESGKWLIKSIIGFTNTKDPDNAKKVVNNFHIFHKEASPSERGELERMWAEGGLGEFPGEAGVN